MIIEKRLRLKSIEKKRFDLAIYKQGDLTELTIEAYGMSGEGIAKKDGFTFFVPFALVGEKIKARITHVNKKGLIFATLNEIVVPSETRIKPPCNRFTRCGGCDLMHMDYATQLEVKRANVISLLKKNANITFDVDETVPCSEPLGYRNKIQLPFGTVNGKAAVGFFRENSHKIVSITKCFLHGEWVDKLIAVFLEYANQYGISVFDDIKKKGLLRHMVARFTDGQYCIVVVTNNAPLPKKKELVAMLKNAIGDDFSLYESIKKSYDNVILGESVNVIKQRRMTVDVCGIKMDINPYSFLQLNNEIRDKIYMRIADDVCKTAESPTVIDAYAGVGALGAILAKRGANVYNIEIVKEATEDGEKLAVNNGLSDRITNINGDAAEELPKLINRILGTEIKTNGDINKENSNEDIAIILDPPRKGCDERVLEAINGINQNFRLYYISCNPATLTRDLKILTSSGRYEIHSITPYDMFPQTKHVETLVVLSHKKPDSHLEVKIDFNNTSLDKTAIAKRAEKRKPQEKTIYKKIQNRIEEKTASKFIRHTWRKESVKSACRCTMHQTLWTN